MEDLNTIIHTEDGVRVSIDNWDDGLWLSLKFQNASMHATFTREEAEQMLIGLQNILAKENA